MDFPQHFVLKFIFLMKNKILVLLSFLFMFLNLKNHLNIHYSRANQSGLRANHSAPGKYILDA